MGRPSQRSALLTRNTKPKQDLIDDTTTVCVRVLALQMRSNKSGYKEQYACVDGWMCSKDNM